MNRSKPSSVVGGGEMKRVTSSVVKRASSERASAIVNSRSANPSQLRVGRPLPVCRDCCCRGCRCHHCGHCARGRVNGRHGHYYYFAPLPAGRTLFSVVTTEPSRPLLPHTMLSSSRLPPTTLSSSGLRHAMLSS